MRKAGEIRYHLFEVNADGTELRQLTDGPDDEVEPCYLPDGGIVYVSSQAAPATRLATRTPWGICGVATATAATRGG